MKTIVTHLSPDIDAICAVWLVKKYLKNWDEANVSFVPTGSTLDNIAVDTDPHTIHVDTGFGQFDHHQTSDYTSASRLVLDHLTDNDLVPRRDQAALERLVEIVTFSDHFRDVYFPNPTDDYYLMFAKDLVHHYKTIAGSDLVVLEFGINILEATLYGLRQKIHAEKDIKDGYLFQSSFGQSIALNCGNSQALVLAQKQGFMLAIQRNPQRHFVKIKLHPKSEQNLKKVHEKLTNIDPKATWIYHPSGKMIINGSAHNPDVVPSKLSLLELVAIVKEI